MRVAVNTLQSSSDNPRIVQASEQEDRELKASLAAHGQIHPLIVRRINGGADLEVIDGNRRLRMMQELQWGECEVHVSDSELPVFEVGAIANMIRAKMHPLDESDVISRLIEAGEDMAQVSTRFGQTVLWCKQRVALSTLPIECKAMLRDGKLELEAAMALTRLDFSQMQWWLTHYKKQEYLLNADSIDSLARKEKINAERALFDLALYPEEKISRDLFSTEILLSDRVKFMELQEAAIKALAEETAKEGWDEVIVVRNSDEISRATRNMVQIKGRISKARRAEMMAMLVLNPYGKINPTVEGGWVKKSKAKVQNGKHAEAGADVTEAEVAPPTEMSINSTQLSILEHLVTWRVQEMARTDSDFAEYMLVSLVLNANQHFGLQLPKPLDYGSNNGKLAGVSQQYVEPVECMTFEDWQEHPTEQKLAMLSHAAMRLVPLPDMAYLDGLPAEILDELVLPPEFYARYTLGVLLKLAREGQLLLNEVDPEKIPEKKADLVKYVADLFRRAQDAGNPMRLPVALVDAIADAARSGSPAVDAEDC